jgi:GNAT superfamily N-acetyltransferase
MTTTMAIPGGMPGNTSLDFLQTGWRALVASRARWCRPANPVTELRIDVMQPLVDGELEAIYDCICQPGSKLHGLQRRPLHDPRFCLHWREADGEWYAYVEDLARRRLAGLAVFNRLVEVDRRTDRQVRSPHSRFAPQYQRRGLASAVYRSVLDAGTCLLSGARQSPGAHGLWNHLARSYESHYVGISETKRLQHLGRDVPQAGVLDRLATRRLLLGRGRPLQDFARMVGMELPPASP